MITIDSATLNDCSFFAALFLIWGMACVWIGYRFAAWFQRRTQL